MKTQKDGIRRNPKKPWMTRLRPGKPGTAPARNSGPPALHRAAVREGAALQRQGHRALDREPGPLQQPIEVATPFPATVAPSPPPLLPPSRAFAQLARQGSQRNSESVSIIRVDTT